MSTDSTNSTSSINSTNSTNSADQTKSRELLITTTCDIDPGVTKVGEDICKIIEEGKKVKKLVPVGERAFEKVIGDSEENISIEDIEEETMSKIMDVAWRNPVTNELIRHNKQFFHDNKDKIEKQMKELVALYSVKDQKPFFFISPSEARLAIDYVKQVRSGFIQDKEEEQKKDGFVKKFIESYSEDKDIPLYTLSYINMCDLISGLTINALNLIFANMEKDDCIPNAMVINASTYSDIRGWGATVWDQYSYKTILERGVMGKIWTAEIYLSRKVARNKILLMNTVEDKVIKHEFMKI